MGGAEILRKVPPQAFRPQPRVNSALIEIKIEKNRGLANDRTWRALLARSFTQRRKTLVNNWTAGYADIDRERRARNSRRARPFRDGARRGAPA